MKWKTELVLEGFGLWKINICDKVNLLGMAHDFVAAIGTHKIVLLYYDPHVVS